MKLLRDWKLLNYILAGFMLFSGVLVIASFLNDWDWLRNPTNELSEPRSAFLQSTLGLVTFIVSGITFGISIRQQKSQRTEQPKEKTLAQQLIDVVRETWIDGYLKSAVSEKIDVPLVPAPVGSVKGEHAPLEWVENSTQVFEAYKHMEKVDGGMLILGRPGAGKTIMMLQLAEKLLERAATDGKHIPLIFNLSSWAAEQKPLKDWLDDEMWRVYGINKKAREEIAKQPGLFMLMLDGLDEVRSEDTVWNTEARGKIPADPLRDQCVREINEYRTANPSIRLVVCNRIAENDKLGEKLDLNAIRIKQLTYKQVKNYLEDNLLHKVAEILDEDAPYKTLARDPFILSTMAFAFKDWRYSELTHALENSSKDRTEFLLETYVDLRIQSTLAPKDYKTHHYLEWLAVQLARQRQQVFYIEEMQPTWLRGEKQQRYKLYDGLLDHITPSENLTWSWSEFYRELRFNLNYRRISQLLLSGLLVGLFGGMFFFRITGMFWGLLLIGPFFGLLGGLLLGLFFGLFDGLLVALSTKTNVGGRTQPNKGIWDSLRNGLLVGLLTGLIFLLFFWLLAAPLGMPNISLAMGLSFGLLFGSSFGLISGLYTIIQHIILRRMLQNEGVLPSYSGWLSWLLLGNYAQFLDYCADIFLLRKVGGGYIFIHRTLQEYLAKRWAESNPQ